MAVGESLIDFARSRRSLIACVSRGIPAAARPMHWYGGKLGLRTAVISKVYAMFSADKFVKLWKTWRHDTFAHASEYPTTLALSPWMRRVSVFSSKTLPM